MASEGAGMNEQKVLRLYPTPPLERAIEGLYLDDEMGYPDRPDEPFVYTNFISSLDGRIAVDNPAKGRRTAPPAITNGRDWRLFQELAAGADVVIVSASFLRDLADGRAQHKLPLSTDPAFADLLDWRRDKGMPDQPAIVVLSRSLNLPLAELCQTLQRPVYFAVGRLADQGNRDAVERTGARVLVAGDGPDVEGRPLIDTLGREGFRRIYSMAGPGILNMLLRDRVLHRLYLTHFHRMLGGRSFDTLLEGEPLDTPASFVPRSLYYDAQGMEGVGQFFAAYDAL
jgi:riboflavin biosynthesis pyrimidine reductase